MYKIIVLFFVVSFFVTTEAKSKEWKGDLKANQLEEFHQGKYTTVIGNVFINGTIIKDLHLLSRLELVRGNLIIGEAKGVKNQIKRRNLNLQSLKGLKRLRRIEGALEISQNNNLESIKGISNLREVKSVVIRNNMKLENLDGFEKVTLLYKGIEIYNNDALINLEGLKNLSYVGSSAIFEGNSSLSSLYGLEKLEVVGDQLSIRGNETLQSIESLSLLTKIGGLKVIENDLLSNLQGLDSVVNITSDLILKGNDALQDLHGLENVKYIGGSIELNNNSNLSHLTGLNFGVCHNTITIYKNAQLKDLSGIETSDKLHANLYVEENASLESFVGFESVKEIDGFMKVTYNPALTSLKGFDGLTKVAGALEIYGNRHLKEICGFPSLKVIEKDLVVKNNDELIQFAGFNQLNTVGEDILITKNKLLDRVEITDSLELCGGDIVFQHNSVMTELKGSNRLKEAVILKVQSNASLQSVEGFNGLLQLNTLAIGENENLESIDAFRSLNEVSDSISIIKNPKLRTITGFNEIAYVPSLSLIECSSLEQLNAFQSISRVGKMIFIDSKVNDLRFLNNLVRVDKGNLFIKNHRNLVSLEGLDNLSYIKGELWVYENESLKDLRSLNQLRQVKSICIFYNSSLSDFTGINTCVIKDNLDIYENIYNPRSFHLLNGLFTYRTIPEVAKPFIVDDTLTIDLVEEYEDEDEEEYEQEYSSSPWKRGSIYASADQSERLYHATSLIHNDSLFFYFVGVANPKTMREGNKNAKVYELDQDGNVFIIDEFDYEYLYELYGDDVQHNHYGMFKVRDGKLYYQQLIYGKAHDKKEYDYFNILEKMYVPGSKAQPEEVSERVDPLEYRSSALDMYIRFTQSPDRHKIAWTAKESTDIYVVYDEPCEKIISQLVTYGADSYDTDYLKGDFKIKPYFPSEHEKTDAIFGGMSWSDDSKVLYFDNSAFDLACIWRFDLEAKKIEKIVPEHEAILPHYFKYMGKEYIAYTQDNKLMIAISPE
ncbi:hypothetical protein OAT16_02310 [Prolixibacteraceae bacterium]|nr:hypothetical protein [Prolixibacteraceae bacterium]